MAPIEILNQDDEDMARSPSPPELKTRQPQLLTHGPLLAEIGPLTHSPAVRLRLPAVPAALGSSPMLERLTHSNEVVPRSTAAASIFHAPAAAPLTAARVDTATAMQNMYAAASANVRMSVNHSQQLASQREGGAPRLQPALGGSNRRLAVTTALCNSSLGLYGSGAKGSDLLLRSCLSEPASSPGQHQPLSLRLSVTDPDAIAWNQNNNNNDLAHHLNGSLDARSTEACNISWRPDASPSYAPGPPMSALGVMNTLSGMEEGMDPQDPLHGAPETLDQIKSRVYTRTRLLEPEDSPLISQVEFVKAARAAGMGVPATQVFFFWRKRCVSSGKTSCLLNLTEAQLDIMYAVAGCSDIRFQIGKVMPQVREFLEESYGIDKHNFAIWFKNRTPHAMKVRKVRKQLGVSPLERMGQAASPSDVLHVRTLDLKVLPRRDVETQRKQILRQQLWAQQAEEKQQLIYEQHQQRMLLQQQRQQRQVMQQELQQQKTRQQEEHKLQEMQLHKQLLQENMVKVHGQQQEQLEAMQMQQQQTMQKGAVWSTSYLSGPAAGVKQLSRLSEDSLCPAASLGQMGPKAIVQGLQQQQRSAGHVLNLSYDRVGMEAPAAVAGPSAAAANASGSNTLAGGWPHVGRLTPPSQGGCEVQRPLLSDFDRYFEDNGGGSTKKVVGSTVYFLRSDGMVYDIDNLEELFREVSSKFD